MYKIYKVNNVKSYEYIMSDYKTWRIELYRPIWTKSPEQPLLHDPTELYFILETVHARDAFCHWVFEAAIYIPSYLALKQKYPSLKLVLSIPKTFKKLFCDYFGIPQEDIVYFDLNKEIVECNICFFPSPIVAMNIPQIQSNYQMILNNFFNIFNYTEDPPSCDWLILPRQIKENYKGNDRSIPLLKIIDFFEQKKINHRVLHTDTITDIREQIHIVRSAKNIIVVDGAAFYVNSMFVKNKRIIVMNMGHHSQNQINQFDNFKYLYLTIVNKNNNQVQFIETEEECIQALNADIQ